MLACLLLVVAMALSSGPRTYDQRTFDQLVVLGDSLSDMGNAGRFSNGKAALRTRPESASWPRALAQSRFGAPYLAE